MRHIHYVISLAAEQDRLRVDFETDHGEVVVLHAVQYETHVQGAWQPVARYDTAHGFFHMDVYGVRGPMKYRIAIADLSAALTFAIDDLKAHWQVYKQRFLGGPR